MKIDGYSQVDVSVGVPASVNDAHVHEMQRRSDKLMRRFIGDLMADRIATDRNELKHLRERVAGLLERNTSLVHAKRDLEARVREFDRDLTLQQAQVKAERANRESCREEIRCLEARVKELEAETNGGGVNVRDIPIREVPICSRRDAN